MANYSATSGDKAGSLRLGAEAVDVARQHGDGDLLARCLHTLGLLDPDPVNRTKTFRELAGLNVTQQLSFACRLAGAACIVDDHVLAAELSQRCLEIAKSLGDMELEGLAYRCLALVARSLGDNEKADELESLGNVLCPLPDVDLSPFETAAESGNTLAAWEAFKSIIKAPD